MSLDDLIPAYRYEDILILVPEDSRYRGSVVKAAKVDFETCKVTKIDNLKDVLNTYPFIEVPEDDYEDEMDKVMELAEEHPKIENKILRALE